MTDQQKRKVLGRCEVAERDLGARNAGSFGQAPMTSAKSPGNVSTTFFAAGSRKASRGWSAKPVASTTCRPFPERADCAPHAPIAEWSRRHVLVIEGRPKSPHRSAQTRASVSSKTERVVLRDPCRGGSLSRAGAYVASVGQRRSGPATPLPLPRETAAARSGARAGRG